MNLLLQLPGRWPRTRILSSLLVLLSGALSAAPQRAPKSPAAAKAKAPKEAPVPFRAGERLEYDAAWNGALSAATAQLSVRERKDFFGKPAWHLQAITSTITPLRYLYTIDDQFDSYADAQSLATLQFELYLREQKKSENHLLRFVAEGDPAPGDVPAVRVPRGTCDPLAALFALRAVDWTRQASLEMPVFDGRRLYQMRARLLEPNAKVEVRAGTFAASRIEIRVFERGRELRDIRMTLSLARDVARTPILIEAELPFGSLTVGLRSASGQTTNPN